MDFDHAFSAHAEWKLKLRRFLMGLGEAIDPVAAEKDDLCDLGKWIHSDGINVYGELPEFKILIKEHSAFHKLAGVVVRSALSGKKDKAQQMIDAGGDFSNQSIKITTALTGFKKKVAP